MIKTVYRLSSEDLKNYKKPKRIGFYSFKGPKIQKRLKIKSTNVLKYWKPLRSLTGFNQ